jgi:hypothetical protein
VPDKKDKCPATPVGATVDATGCPTDSDHDGVYDGIDKCPNTPVGVSMIASTTLNAVRTVPVICASQFDLYGGNTSR